VGLLGHEAVAVRTGAIYSLQQLMVEAPETLGLTICDVLAVYVNERGPKAEWDFEQCKKSNYSNLLPPPIEDSVVPRDTLSKDILAALRALANRTLPSHLEDKLDFDLECFDWGLLYPNRHGFSAADVYASKAFFDDTKMSIQQRQPRRILKRKTLFGARLGGCDFRGVSLEGSGGVVSFSGYSPDQVAKHFRVLPFEAFKDKCITDKCITWDERTVFPDMTRRYPADGSVIKDEPSGGSSAATPPTA
jgi:hypothetical protein